MEEPAVRTSIVSPDEVINRIAKDEEIFFQESITRINMILDAAQEFPVTIKESDLGPTKRVRQRILERIKYVGWFCNSRASKEDSRYWVYEISPLDKKGDRK
jgi:hypothetical protein